jgi:hypothetical protein
LDFLNIFEMIIELSPLAFLCKPKLQNNKCAIRK